jgi:predicted enzyme related to lactoylglutathione lyase
MGQPINSIVIYAKNTEKMIAFYENHFGFKSQTKEGDRIIELIPSNGGASLMIHPSGKGIKEGQACVKLVFDVKDVEAFKDKCAENGLTFGVTHQADGYVFSNAKDPGKNSIQISSRAFKENV